MVKYAFSSWGGDITGNLNPVTFDMPNVDINLVANYSTITRRINFTSQPIGVQISVKVGTNTVVPLGNGQYIEVPEGETVQITAPAEVVG